MSIPSANERSLSLELEPDFHPAILAHQRTVRTVHSGPMSYFPRLIAGPTHLSIQASDFNYSEPRDNSHAFLGQYEAVEVALINPDGEWFDPETATPELAAILEDIGMDQVAGYVSWPDVNRLYLALVALNA